MKKMTQIIPIVMIITITVLTIIFINFQEASNYLKLKKLNGETISIKYDDNNENLIDNVKMLQSIAQKNNVILLKANVDNKKENRINIYLSLETIDELNTLLQKNFKIKNLDTSKTQKSFISTYNHNDNNQIGIIKDLLGDHFYTYYLMDQMVEKNDGLFGNYFIFYNDFHDYSNFMSEANNLMGYNIHSLSISNGIQNYIGIAIYISVFFLLLFYFIFQIYEYNNHSKKIGCMKLLGFDNKTINKNMIHKKLFLYLVCVFIILILVTIIVKNITIYHLIFILLINLLIIVLTYLISYISCIIINKTYQTNNILKLQNGTLKISRVSYKFKSIMTIIIICLSVIAFENMGNLYDKLKTYHSSKNLLDYSVFQSYIVNQPELYDYEKQHNLYLDIINNMDTFYAQFQDYSQYTQQDWENTKKAEEEGTFFGYDSVDKNYLKKENIIVYDLENKEVDLDIIDQIVFLFPKSKKEMIPSFAEFHKNINEYYSKFNKNYTFKAYLYDNQKLDTYQIKNKYVDSPILRVIDSSLKTPYFMDGLGISFFGNGMITGLKIKLIDGDKEKTVEVLNQYIEKSELSNLLNSSSFITYREYFNDEILESQLIILFISFAIILTLIVYCLVSLQLLKLYIESNMKKVLVKKLLGFENSKIFEQVYRKNLNNILISILLSFIILVIIKKLNIFFLIMISIFLILDLLITVLSIKSIKLTTIYLDLKGGQS